MGSIKPYYADEHVQLFHGDCLDITAWLDADVLVTDPPYGIGWKRGAKKGRWDTGSAGIANDGDTSFRDAALERWGDRPAVVFGSFYAPEARGKKHVLVFRKSPDSGVVGSTTGWRRDLEPIFLTGRWPRRAAHSSSLITTGLRAAGNPSSPAGRFQHPHAKPLDVMETLIRACPPGVIADPFSGSGSTLVAAKLQGRKAIGVELEERYCEIAARRLAQDSLPFASAA